MPLAFDSKTHGKIAFGFFNIDVDMLLLEHYFFFADYFWEKTVWFREKMEMAPKDREDSAMDITFDVWDIPPHDVGDLMGAIHGVRHTGFIGEVYKTFPFPKRPEEFKQMPDGKKNRPVITDIIRKYGTQKSVSVCFDIEKNQFFMGEYEFDGASFHELIQYVQRGGMPGWKDQKRPAYLML